MAKRKGQQDNDLKNITQKTKDRATRTPLSHRLKKERQYNGPKERNNKTNNDLQNTTQKTKDRATRTPLSHRLKKERQYNDQEKETTR